MNGTRGVKWLVITGVVGGSLLASLPVRGATAGAAPYNSVVSYTGPYSGTSVYFRPNERGRWKVSLPFPTMATIVCRDTLRHLGQTGLWKGHLKPDGSCYPPDSEPSSWASGNRLNYDVQNGN